MSSEESKSQRRLTADAIVAAFNRMDVDAIVAFRTPDCVRTIVPASMSLAPTDNQRYAASLQRLRAIFHNFSLTVNEVIEDDKANRLCMHLSARSDTLAGEYVNEYMWTLHFNEDGTKITKQQEFVDTIMQRDFWPKLQQAMKEHAAVEAAKKDVSHA